MAVNDLQPSVEASVMVSRGVRQRLTRCQEAGLSDSVVLRVEFECHSITDGGADIRRTIRQLTIITNCDLVIDGLRGRGRS